MLVLVLDNYDSFTYNLVQYLGELGAEPMVVRNDKMTPEEADEIPFERLVVSPGPGTPEDAGYSIEFIERFGPPIPTLGVCLGHQAIAVAYGGKVDLAPEPRHGKTSSGAPRRPGDLRWIGESLHGDPLSLARRQSPFPTTSSRAPGARMG